MTRAVEAVRSFVAGREPLADTLTQIAEVATRALRAEMAGLTLLYPDGKARTAVFTDPDAKTLDESQYGSDRGPCLQAFRTRATVIVRDASDDDGWPEFAAAAREHGIRSSLSAPLVVAGEGIGALNLYSSRDANFTDEETVDAEIYARQAAVALANAQAYWEQAALAQNLTAAMESRATIEQAKGIIMATARVGPEEAFDVLRQQSQSENRKVREIAAEIVERQVRHAASGDGAGEVAPS